MKHTLKEIVTNTMAVLSHICEGKVYFVISVPNISDDPDYEIKDSKYELCIDSLDSDWKATHILPEYKAITLMRWIRRGIIGEDGSFIQLF